MTVREQASLTASVSRAKQVGKAPAASVAAVSASVTVPGVQVASAAVTAAASMAATKSRRCAMVASRRENCRAAGQQGNPERL